MRTRTIAIAIVIAITIASLSWTLRRARSVAIARRIFITATSKSWLGRLKFSTTSTKSNTTARERNRHKARNLYARSARMCYGLNHVKYWHLSRDRRANHAVTKAISNRGCKHINIKRSISILASNLSYLKELIGSGPANITKAQRIKTFTKVNLAVNNFTSNLDRRLPAIERQVAFYAFATTEA